MSTLVFPTSLKGLSVTMSRGLLVKTRIQESVSGKEWRKQDYTSPRAKYAIEFEFLRNQEARRELNRVFDFFTRHGGQLDSFLLEDPEDKVAVDQYLGSGDDTAVVPPTFFQLQRALRTTQRSDGGESSGHPVINYSPASARFVSTAVPWTATVPWSVSTGGSIQDFAGTAPDGTATAGKFSNGNTYGRDVALTHNSFLGPRLNQVGPRGAYSWSIWVRALTMEGPREVALQFGGGTGTDIWADAYVIDGNATVAADPVAGRAAWRFTLLDTKWTRIGITANPKGGPGQQGDDPWTYGVFLPQPYSEVLVWGSQLEIGSKFSKYVEAMDPIGALYGHYGAGTEYGIAEPPLTVWPGTGDGSEPVYELRPCGIDEFEAQWPGTWGAGQYLPLIGSYGGTGTAASASSLDWQGKRAPHAGASNLIRFSNDFSQSAAWTAAATGTGTAPTFATLRATASSDLGFARGPDGSRDYGNAVVFDVGAGTTSGATSSLTQTVDHPLLVQGQQYTFSVWAFPWKSPVNDLPTIPFEIIENTSGTTSVFSLSRINTIVGSRIAVTFTAGASTTITLRWRGDLAAPTGLTSVKILLWGAQLERTVSGSPSWFLPTQAAAVLAAPEVRDNQPSIYKWDQGMHPFGTLLDPRPRVNLAGVTSWSTGGADSPDNPTGYPAGIPAGAGTVGVGTSTGSAIAAGGGAYRVTTGSMLCSSIYVRATSTSTTTSFKFGLRRDTPADSTTNTIDFNPNNGVITRAGSRVVSAYTVALPDRWFRLVMVSTWDNADTTQTPIVGATGAACSTYLHIVEPGRSVGSPFVGATWPGDYTILDGPSTNHPNATPGTVLFPGDLDWLPLENPPQLGQYFTWSGGFYHRVRFEDEEMTADRMVDRIWSTGSINLIAVKP